MYLFFLIYLFFGCVGSSLLHGLSLVAVSRGYSSCGGFSCCGAQAVGVQASVVVARGL